MKIIDPFTLVSYDINTPKGKHVLLNYVKNYQSGGSWTGELEDSLEDSDGIDIGVEDTGFSSDGEAAGGGGGAARARARTARRGVSPSAGGALAALAFDAGALLRGARIARRR